MNGCERNNSSSFNCHDKNDIIMISMTELENLGFGIRTSTLINRNYLYIHIGF